MSALDSPTSSRVLAIDASFYGRHRDPHRVRHLARPPDAREGVAEHVMDWFIAASASDLLPAAVMGFCLGTALEGGGSGDAPNPFGPGRLGDGAGLVGLACAALFRVAEAVETSQRIWDIDRFDTWQADAGRDVVPDPASVREVAARLNSPRAAVCELTRGLTLVWPERAHDTVGARIITHLTWWLANVRPGRLKTCARAGLSCWLDRGVSPDAMELFALSLAAPPDTGDDQLAAPLAGLVALEALCLSMTQHRLHAVAGLPELARRFAEDAWARRESLKLGPWFEEVTPGPTSDPHEGPMVSRLRRAWVMEAERVG